MSPPRVKIWMRNRRVVLPSGELREYSPPATAGLVLQQEAAVGEGWFLFDADGMGLEGTVIVAVGAFEELRPGQIYLVLPAQMRRRRLTGVPVFAWMGSVAAADRGHHDTVGRRGAAAALGGAAAPGTHAAAPPLIWVVVEPAPDAPATTEVLRATGVMYRHLTWKPEKKFIAAHAKAHVQQNTALAHVEKHRLDGGIHFAAAAYDTRFFDQICGPARGSRRGTGRRRTPRGTAPPEACPPRSCPPPRRRTSRR
jgi:hypothetical protein